MGPSRDIADCARRSPHEATLDAGSIPATSTSIVDALEERPRRGDHHRGGAVLSSGSCGAPPVRRSSRPAIEAGGRVLAEVSAIGSRPADPRHPPPSAGRAPARSVPAPSPAARPGCRPGRPGRTAGRRRHSSAPACAARQLGACVAPCASNSVRRTGAGPGSRRPPGPCGPHASSVPPKKISDRSPASTDGSNGWTRRPRPSAASRQVFCGRRDVRRRTGRPPALRPRSPA